MDSRRELIMQELLRRARRYIATASRDPVRVPSESLPRLVIQDQQESIAAPTYKRHDLQMSVVVELTDQVDLRTQTVSVIGNRHLAFVIQNLIDTDTSLGGLAQSIEYQQSTIDYQDGSDPMIRITALFNVRYAYPLGDPFTA